MAEVKFPCSLGVRFLAELEHAATLTIKIQIPIKMTGSEIRGLFPLIDAFNLLPLGHSSVLPGSPSCGFPQSETQSC